MEYEQNNNKNHLKENDLYMMVNELKNKYENLEKNQKMNEEQIIKNGKAIYNLNMNLKILKDFAFDLKKQVEQNIRELKENIDKIKENVSDKIRNPIEEQINNLENKYSEKNKEIDEKIETLKNEIKDIKININKNDINNNINNKNNNNNKENNNNNININHNKDIELIIDKNEEKTIFQKFENLLATIIDKNDIDNKSKEELNQYCEKLIINNISPIEYSANYFKTAYKYFQIEICKEPFDKVLKANEKVIPVIEEIENKITKKMNDIKNEKMPKKKVDKKIEEFRKKHSIMEEDASDELINEYLKKFKKDEKKAVEAILEKILNANKENKPK